MCAKSLYGLIGKKLGHSFSKRFFEAYFAQKGLQDHHYELFEKENLDGFKAWVLAQPGLRGLNVTIPYKQAVIPHLDELSAEANRIGAVNTIKLSGERLLGYNTDYHGFKMALEEFLIAEKTKDIQALVLGTGGAARAVWVALEDMGIPYQKVSRQAGGDSLSYAELHQQMEHVQSHRLIINTTPLGMYPSVAEAPDIPYERLGAAHYLFDLVYNPEQTLFMKRGLERGAHVRNGLGMLEGQALKAWEIWQAAD